MDELQQVLRIIVETAFWVKWSRREFRLKVNAAVISVFKDSDYWLCYFSILLKVVVM